MLTDIPNSCKIMYGQLYVFFSEIMINQRAFAVSLLIFQVVEKENTNKDVNVNRSPVIFY